MKGKGFAEGSPTSRETEPSRLKAIEPFYSGGPALESFIGSFDFRPAIMTLGKAHLARRRQLCRPFIPIQGSSIHD
jgi:hypothetical protein